MNTIDANDSANFLAFPQELHKDVSAKSITVYASVPIKPFWGADWNLLTNVWEFAKALDWINIRVWLLVGRRGSELAD